MQAGEMATEAGGTHPTGMHSCIEILRTYNILLLVTQHHVCNFNVQFLGGECK